ncbi:MAG: PhoH family protein [Infirmifilum sp.]
MSIKEFQPATQKQKLLYNTLDNKEIDLIGVFGPSGTGKSFVVILYGVKAILEQKYQRMVVARPLVSLLQSRVFNSVELGKLYYELASAYLYDIATGYIEEKTIKDLMSEGKLVFIDPGFLTGRTFDNTLVFLDDVQFLDPLILPEALIRIGSNSKLVIAGDPVLQILSGNERNTAIIARELLLGEEKSLVIDFGVEDIVRTGSKRGFRLALETRLRRRTLTEEEKKVRGVLLSHAPDADIISVIWLRDLKDKYGAKTSPDVLVIVKENSLSRLIGKRGERINKAQEEAGAQIRGIELTNDLSEIIRAIHPVGWIHKHIVKVELAGGELEVYVNPEEYGAFVGKEGAYVRFLDDALKRILGIGVRGRHAELHRAEEKKRK